MENNKIEIWKDIEDYEGIYQISTFGRVKSLARMIKNGAKEYYRKEIIMTLSYNYDGYYIITLHKNNIPRTYKIHRLVAIYFIPNCKNKPVVNHLDGNKTNNHIDNLEWSTYKKNSNHAVDMRLVTNNKYVAKYSLDDELIDVYYSMREAARENNGRSGNISSVVSGRSPTSLGFKWKAIDKDFFENNGGVRLVVTMVHTEKRKSEKTNINKQRAKKQRREKYLKLKEKRANNDK